MAFDSIQFTHFMTATRGHKTGKEDDGCGNWVGKRECDFYEQIHSRFFVSVKIGHIKYKFATLNIQKYFNFCENYLYRVNSYTNLDNDDVTVSRCLASIISKRSRNTSGWYCSQE